MTNNYAPVLVGAAVGGAAGYLVRPSAMTTLVGLAAGGGLGFAFRQIQGAAALEPGKPPTKTSLPLPFLQPPVGRPQVPQAVEMAFQGQGPSLACGSAFLGWWGVHSWSGHPDNPSWPNMVKLFSWSGAWYPPSMIPVIDQHIAAQYNCKFAEGVSKVGRDCNGVSVVQNGVAAPMAACGIAKV